MLQCIGSLPHLLASLDTSCLESLFLNSWTSLLNWFRAGRHFQERCIKDRTNTECRGTRAGERQKWECPLDPVCGGISGSSMEQQNGGKSLRISFYVVVVWRSTLPQEMKLLSASVTSLVILRGGFFGLLVCFSICWLQIQVQNPMIIFPINQFFFFTCINFFHSSNLIS